MSQTRIPEKQYAVQLVGPKQLKLNTEKPVDKTGPYHILARIEAVGLCFSDLKLLNQFSDHVRKSEIVSGIDRRILDELPSYAPGLKPTVPGHEAVCEIVAVGDKVKHHQVGERCLIQTDYRAIRTAGSNAAFGYNIEGALQEYVLMDERIVMDPDSGERFLIPVDDQLSASAVTLVEPWACVEDSYVTTERRTIKTGGRLLIVAEGGRQIEGVYDAFSPDGPPAELTAVCPDEEQKVFIKTLGIETIEDVDDLQSLPDETFDDIIVFSAEARAFEILNDKIAAKGVLCAVLGGKKIGRPVSVGVGRVHYGMTRWIGTTGFHAADAYATIPETGELRDRDRVLIVGAGGPMGQMHVIRDVCSDATDLTVVGADIDDDRLATIGRKAEPLARANGHALRMVNTKENPLEETFSYIAIMVPVGVFVAEAIERADRGCPINIFAGIPATVRQDLDLDAYIEKSCYLFGTSGSTIRDMKIVLEKVQGGRLDTNCSVDAVAGMAGAVDGMAAVENRTLAGKIIVYPMLHDVGLVTLEDLADQYPTVAAKLRDGIWTKEAEAELLRMAAG